MNSNDPGRADFSAMFSQAAVGLAEVDADGRYVRVNDCYREMVGRSRQELLGSRMEDLTHPEDRAVNLSLLESSSASGNPFVMEKRYLRPNGAPVWVNISVTPLFNAEGAPCGHLGVAVDITERRRAEAALAESEERYRRAITAFHGATYETDLQTGYAYRAPRVYEMLGVRPEDAEPTREWWFNRIHPEDAPRFHERLEALFSGRTEELDLEFRVRHADGSWVWVWQRGLAMRDAAGRVTGTVGAILDISRRKATEAALRESEARFRHMADSAPALIWVTDADGQVAFANMHFDYLFGCSASDMLGKGWRAVIHPDDLSGFCAASLAAFTERKPFKAEVRVLDKEGAVRWMLCEGVMRLDDAGRFLGYTGCGVDITEGKLDDERQQLLIHELNHRVKNTLATVQSIASQTLRNAASTGSAREAFETRLIALSRAHDVLTRENWEGADLGEIVGQALEPYRSQGEAAFSVEGPRIKMPPRTALAIALALQELATNAAKYGALSATAGRVQIRWSTTRVEGVPHLHLRWEETNGPPVAEPTRRGFGTRLIERGLAQDLGGAVRIDFAPAGVVCTIEAPLTPVP